MGRMKDHFRFRSAQGKDAVLLRLKEQVLLLRDREYLLEETERGFDLAIGRGGHQGGYWYCATVTEDGEGSLIDGRVVYRTHDGELREETWLWKLEFYFLFVVLLPLVLAVWVYRLFRPEITDEERLVEFMVTKMDFQWLK